jgi:hypothetical protein
MKEQTTNSLHAGAVGIWANFESSYPSHWKQYRPHHDSEVPFARSITDATGMSPSVEKKWQHAYRLLGTSSIKEGVMYMMTEKLSAARYQLDIHTGYR